MFKSLKATDLIEIKRNNVREYSIYCSQAHLYFSNQELWRVYIKNSLILVDPRNNKIGH